jgi:ectonucleotide pyrophosphatase/phosphodiesterase family protein 4
MNILCVFTILILEILIVNSIPSSFKYKFEKNDQTIQNLILISFDGFRWDYLENNTLPYIKKYFVNSGVKVNRGLKNAFTTVTYPNHWTLATGFYPESHGNIFSK